MGKAVYVLAFLVGLSAAAAPTAAQALSGLLITAGGAGGGTGSAFGGSTAGGTGASEGGTASLAAGFVLDIVVGQ